MAVWAVAILPEVGVMVTASADKTIKLWKAGKCTNTLKGHTDAVRALAVVDKTQFLSASNDAHVRRWSSSGDCLGTYSGHTNYIYSLSLLGPGGDSWVTGGEDRSVRVWKDGPDWRQGCCAQLEHGRSALGQDWRCCRSCRG